MEALMAVTIKQTEAAPDDYPAAPAGLSTAAAALSKDMIWQRIEAYTAYRWTSRAVVWIVEGPGEWAPPLSPATVTTVEIWTGGAWQNVTPDASPLGYWLSGCGPYRFTGTAGGGDPEVAAAVNEAFRRIGEYMAADPGTAGATSERFSEQDIDSRQVDRSASWMAKAMQNSGAGDLLRQYRKV
jgi:hypothetical protein